MSLIYFLLVVGIPVVAIGFGLWSIGNDIYIYAYNEANFYLKVRRPLLQKYRKILIEYFAYYKMLSHQDQQKFEHKLVRFMYSKRFIARGLKSISDEMRVLVSATAVQLTFGLPQVYLANFDKILIYPDEYYSHINKKYHLGEVNPRAGIIVLSWKAFVQGFGNLNDSLNLGIHELAHAIHFENRIMNKEYDFLDKQAVEELNEITQREIKLIRMDSDSHFLRKYAGTNEYEFFAVSLEYFFEKPNQMKEAIPDLFNTLKRLLKQDPSKLYNFEKANYI